MDENRIDILATLLMKFMRDNDISLAEMARLLAAVEKYIKGKQNGIR